MFIAAGPGLLVAAPGAMGDMEDGCEQTGHVSLK